MHFARRSAVLLAAVLLGGARARAGAQATSASITVTATIASAASAEVAALTSPASTRYDVALRVVSIAEGGSDDHAAEPRVVVARGVTAAEALALSRRLRVVSAPASVRIRIELMPVDGAAR